MSRASKQRAVTFRIDVTVYDTLRDLSALTGETVRAICQRGLQAEVDRLVASDPRLTGVLETMAAARQVQVRRAAWRRDVEGAL